MKKSIVVAIYGHPEHYPPTLNAVSQLSKMFDDVAVLYRPYMPLRWEYPGNVGLHPSGKDMPVRMQEQASPLKKLWLFFQFVLKLARLCQQKKPATVLVYDQVALGAYSLARHLTSGKPILWYHNHDILEGAKWRIFSPSWIAVKREPKMFSTLDIFTLPTDDRKPYFPMDKLKGKYFLLPNMPSVSFFNTFYEPTKLNGELRLIYQGHMDIGHGLEEVVSLLPCRVEGKPVKVVLVGLIREGFKEKLTPLIEKQEVRHQVELRDFMPYRDLPRLTTTCHIGLAIYTRSDITNSTLGTASNKIFEYAALGLPVLYYDNEHFRKHLGKYPWAVPTGLSAGALLKSLSYILDNYETLSRRARSDFLNELNFEHSFGPVRQYLVEQILTRA